jgi:hypothetical protein
VYEENMKKLLLCVALCVTTTVQASFVSGNDLFKHLTDNNYFSQGYAMGYILGVSDVFSGDSHCMPQGVTAGQVRDVVKNFLEVSPEIRHRPADVIVHVILRSTWPCPTKQNKGKPGA